MRIFFLFLFFFLGGGGLFVCLPPYNSNFRYFEIKSLVLRTSNLIDSTVVK